MKAPAQDLQDLFSACRTGDVEFMSRWAGRDADGFAKCLGADGNGAVALLFAVYRDQPECVQFLLQHVSANVDAPKGNRLIVEASNLGYLRVMRILLDHGADPDLSDEKSNTALGLAAYRGFREAVLILLERGANVNLQINEKPTALSMAAMEGHLQVMRDLLAAGGDHKLVNHFGGSPLFAATAGCQPEAVELLLARGADVTQATFDRGDTTLMMAAYRGYAHLATQFLVKAAECKGGGEAFLNARDINGETALMKACKGGSESVARVLLQHPKLDVDVQDEIYNTALVYAVCAERDGIAEALLVRGASVRPDARALTSALGEASARGMHRVVGLILERGGEDACVNFRGARGFTALELACKRNYWDIAEMLVRAGAAVDAVDGKGCTPLMTAARFETGAEMALWLLERGADPNVHGSQTSPPLVLACSRSAPQFGAVCRALIRAGADVNAQNSRGETALQVAIDNNSKEAVKALLNSGARVLSDNAQRQLVQYIYELKRDLEAMMQVFPHALAASSRGCRR